MILTGKHLNRRTLLRGLGVSMGLPLLDAMTPAGASKAPVTGAPTRLAFVYVPNGINMAHWTPQATGKDFEITRVLTPLKDQRHNLTMLTGLTHNGGRALGDGPGDHARAAASYLTGAHPRKTAGADIKNGVSVDQLAAMSVGKQTRLASIELGIEDGRQVGSCDSGYSCAYSNNISWRGEANPMPPEINPRNVFSRLFGSAAAGESKEMIERRERTRRSILDFVLDDARSVRADLGTGDQRKLDEYLHSIRDIEARIERASKGDAAKDLGLIQPEGTPAEYAEHVRIMFDLMTAAFRTNSTRVATFMMAREGSARPYREIGVPDGHHPLTHHRNNPEMMEKVAQINCYHFSLFSEWIQKLATTPDGDGTLLDHSAIVYGSGISDGNKHLHHDLPVLVAGRMNGKITPGRHIVYDKDTPMTNFYLSMLTNFGVKAESIGDSNGELKGLSELA
jgi:hypothetical protein